jgi:hypothetical protein
VYSTSLNFASTLTYHVGERDQTGVTASYSKNRNENGTFGSTSRFGAGMTPLSDFSTSSQSRSPAENFGLGTSYLHKSGDPGEELKVDLRYTGQDNDSARDTRYAYRLRPASYSTYRSTTSGWSSRPGA